MFSAEFVLGYDAGQHVLIRNGEVVYENDRIIFVGHNYGGRVDESFDLGQSIVTPGLIDLDALTDIDHLILDSWSGVDRAAGMQWSDDYFRHGRRDVFTPEERQLIRKYALVQLALHGITTYMPIASEIHSAWAESCDELIGMAETSRSLGLRGYLGPAYRSGVNVMRQGNKRDVEFDEDEGRAGLSEAVRFLDHAQTLSDPLITGVLLPCRIETVSEEILRRTAAVAHERNVLVRLHCLQGLLERDLLDRWYGLSPLQLLQQTGLLGENLLIPHGIFVDRNRHVAGADHGDLQTLADAKVSIIHCPLTSFRYGMVLDSFAAFREAGINLCMGTDSFPPDLIRGMDTGVHLAKLVDGSPDAAPAEHYFEAATLGGARALGRSDLGRLEPGAQADLVAFSLNDFRDGVLDDPIRTLMLSGTARQATHSVVAGRLIMRDGTIPGIDMHVLRAQAQALFSRMREAYSERDIELRPADELFPPTFPTADAQRPVKFPKGSQMTCHGAPVLGTEEDVQDHPILGMLELAFSYRPWIRRVTSGITSMDISHVLAVSAEALSELRDEDLVEALALFRPLGTKPAAPTTGRALPEADPLVLTEREQVWFTILKFCKDYKARFGYIYLVNVSGKGDEAILSGLKSRLTLSPHEDLEIVRGELASIVMDRLRRLASPTCEGGRDLESEMLHAD